MLVVEQETPNELGQCWRFSQYGWLRFLCLGFLSGYRNVHPARSGIAENAKASGKPTDRADERSQQKLMTGYKAHEAETKEVCHHGPGTGRYRYCCRVGTQCLSK